MKVFSGGSEMSEREIQGGSDQGMIDYDVELSGATDKSYESSSGLK